MKLRVLPPVIPAVNVSCSRQAMRVAAAVVEGAIRSKWTRSMRRAIFAEIIDKCRAVVQPDGSVRLIAAGERVEVTDRRPVTRSPTPPPRAA